MAEKTRVPFTMEAKLVMWSKESMPERNYDREKREWVPTGKQVERTKYIFRDSFGDQYNFIHGNEDYRNYEGKDCVLYLSFEQREFQGKVSNRVKLESVEVLK